MTLMDILEQIVAPTPAPRKPADISDLVPGDVFTGIDHSMYRPQVDYYHLITPLDPVTGYIEVDIEYEDGTQSHAFMWAGYLSIVEVL